MIKSVQLCTALLLLVGCAQIEHGKAIADGLIDKAADKSYDLTCNMRYQTEARFRVRHQLTEKNVRDWCKRSPPQ